MRVAGVAAIVGAVLCGCVESNALHCGDFVCGAGLVCSPTGDQCVPLDKSAACTGLGEGDECAYGTVVLGCA